MPTPVSSTSLAITNPLVLYRTLLSTSSIRPDLAQHRLALQLQSLYNRLRDYEPIAQYGYKLQQLQRTLGSTPANPASETNHAAPRQSIFGSIFANKTRSGSNDSLALTKVLTSHEEAMKIDSPKGLLLHGEVGTGKSMLVDMFAECLPNRKKRRWHYNTFMLEVFAKLERLRRSRELIVPASLGQQEEYSLLWLARELISTSPILFLDEFQLPDRAAAKLLTNLMTCFFQLGGVLVATSNRMPEELDKAAGIGFAPPLGMSALSKFGLRLGKSPFEKRGEFAGFLDLLRARCDVWQMEGSKDYRRDEVEESIAHSADTSSSNANPGFVGLESMSPGNLGLGWEQSSSTDNQAKADHNDRSAASSAPPLYRIASSDKTKNGLQELLSQLGVQAETWHEKRLSVYGRVLRAPRTCNGIARFTFNELCSNALGPTTVLGPADYTTLASHFHTFILTDVPTLSLLQKNEARRLITLLDALYEARCKLAVWAESGPDELFFPETLAGKGDKNSSPPREEQIDQDVTYSETLSEIYQDTAAPFRTNISAYGEPSTGTFPSGEADATHARFAGFFDSDRAEQQKRLSRKHDKFAADVGDAKLLRSRPRADTTADMSADTESGLANLEVNNRGPDFSMGGAFTGDDEKFAFKRARSRLWELCSARWWDRQHDAMPEGNAPHEPSWWRPVSPESRVWERPGDDLSNSENGSDMTTGAHISTDGIGSAASIIKANNTVLFQHGATSPFGPSTEPPPKISWTHAWGMMRWGRKAGRWGQGADAFRGTQESSLDEAGSESKDGCIKRREAWRLRNHDGNGRASYFPLHETH